MKGSKPRSPFGNPTQVQDAKNQITIFGYDKRDRPTSRKDALLKPETAVYNGVNNVTSAIDRKGQRMIWGRIPIIVWGKGRASPPQS